jgi:hypothetical protein
MSLRSRLLRYLLIGLLVLFAAVYGTFSALFFNPLESDLEVDVAALVPRDVDFFVAKADLADAFDRFPHLRVGKRIAASERWKNVADSPEGKSLAQRLRLEETLAELSKATGQIPLGMQPQQVFGGKDLAVAGYFRGASIEQADWAVYGRANWMGKLAAAALEHPGLLRLGERGLQVEVAADQVSVAGANLPRKLFVSRIRDVVIVSTTADLPTKARALGLKGYEDSLFQSAGYHDWVQSASRDDKRDELEIYVDARKAIANLALPKVWPDPKNQEFVTALFGHAFQLGSLKNLMGVVGLDEGLTLDLHGDFSSEQISPEQERLYRTRGFDRAALLGEAAQLAPRDTALFVFLHAPVADGLHMLLGSCEPALKQNIEDLFRSTGKYSNLEKLVAELDSALKDRAALIIRPNDYPPDPEGPPHNDAPVPAMALVLWPKNFDQVNALRQLIGEQGQHFGLKGRKPNDPGFFKNSESGYETREYWSTGVDGTGIVVTANAAQLTIVTNSLGMMGHLLKTYTQKSARYPSLADDERFQALLQSSLKRANFLVYANPATIAPILRNRAQQIAAIAATSAFDTHAERARLETKILRDVYAGRTQDALSPPERVEFDAKVDEEMKALRKRVKEEQIPALMAEQERRITWLEGLTGGILMLALDPKSFDLSVRIIAPIEAK